MNEEQPTPDEDVGAAPDDQLPEGGPLEDDDDWSEVADDPGTAEPDDTYPGAR